MTQNRSHAVMAQRVEAHDSLDHFPTPPWATRALMEHCISGTAAHIWEPACGCGAMARPLAEYATKVDASDVHDYGWGHIVHDFLLPFTPREFGQPDWIITNPPFRLSEQFVDRGLQIASRGVAVLVRSVFIESVGRYKRLFDPRPPSVMAQFVERVPMVKGRLDRQASTATSYCWLIWTTAPTRQTRLFWLPPCRSKLERPGDYESTEVTER
ncbi:MAG: class I SAM-dependent methyltransferase [Hyphomicrobiales bacterium]|nr:class I SAM-dependent methyltransferase [Hyphomicrobiales bacterium]